ncbi:unnamed protein product, partial [Lymnaea stagnalis]
MSDAINASDDGEVTELPRGSDSSVVYTANAETTFYLDSSKSDVTEGLNMTETVQLEAPVTSGLSPSGMTSYDGFSEFFSTLSEEAILSSAGINHTIAELTR